MRPTGQRIAQREMRPQHVAGKAKRVGHHRQAGRVAGFLAVAGQAGRSDAPGEGDGHAGHSDEDSTCSGCLARRLTMASMLLGSAPVRLAICQP